MTKNAHNQIMRRSWALSALITAGVFVVALLAIPNFFPTNDDAYAQQIMAGTVSPEPAGCVTFINYGLCFAVSRLFIVAPGIPWWTITHLLLLYISICFIGRTTILIEYSLDCVRGTWKKYLLLFVAELCLFGIFIARMQFTTTGSILMAAAIFGSCSWVALGNFDRELRPGNLSGIVLPALLGSLGFAFRANSGYLGFAFWICALLFLLLINYKGSLRQCFRAIQMPCIAFIAAVFLSLGLMAIHNEAYSSPQWQSELRTARALAAFTDYPRVPYEQDPERYESVGWDEDLLSLAGNWYFLDDRINAENLEKINAGNTIWLSNLVEQPTNTLRSRLGELTKPVGLSYLVVFFAITIMTCLLAHTNRARFSAAGIALLTSALLGYLVVRGRLPERAELAVLIPAIACISCFIPRELYRDSGQNEVVTYRHSAWELIGCLTVFVGCCVLGYLSGSLGKIAAAVLVVLTVVCIIARSRKVANELLTNKRIWQGFTVFLFCLVLMCGISTVWQYGWFSSSHALAAERATNQTKFFAYVEDHPDILFIQDYNSALTPQDPWLMDWPDNQTGWGGWRYCYEWFDQAMKKAGFDGTPTSSDLLKDNVRFVSGSRETDELMEHYLENLYGPVEFQEEMRLTRTQEKGDIVVYKIVKTEESAS